MNPNCAQRRRPLRLSRRTRASGLCTFWCVLLVATAGAAGIDARRATGPAEPAKAALRTKEFAGALHALQSAAAHGDAESQYLLGLMYATGVGTPVSQPDALRWLTQAAQQSHSEAAYALAGLLANGSAEERAAAADWLARAARAGQPLAVRLAGVHELPLAPARGTLHDAPAARDLLRWAIRRDNAQTLAAAIALAGVDAADDYGRTPLAYAADRGMARAVASLLAAGAKPDAADRFGTTPLMLAAAADGDSAFVALLSAAKQINAKDRTGNTALGYAARAGRTNFVGRLIAAGADMNIANADGWTAADLAQRSGHSDTAQEIHHAGGRGRLAATGSVHESSGIDPARPGELYRGWPALAIAASRDDAKVVAELLAAGARVDEPTPQRDTALLVAVKAHAPTAIPLLVHASADPRYRDAAGASALGVAAARADVAVVDALLRAGVSADNHAQGEDPAIVRAARAGATDVVKRLLESAATVNLPGADSANALLIAAATGNAPLLHVLLAARPDLSVTDRTGRSALWFAASRGADADLDALLAAGAPLEAAHAGQSVLLAALRSGRVSTLQRLLQKGVSVHEKGAGGEGPLIVAAAHSSPELVAALLAAGANVNAQNSAGDTALIVASRSGNVAVCALLVRAGADVRLRNFDHTNAADVATRRGFSQIVALLESSK